MTEPLTAATCSPPIAALAELGHACRFAAGEWVLREGDPGDCVYVVLSGKVRIFVDGDEAEQRRFVIGSYGPGSLFGEGSLDGGPRTATVEAVTELFCARITYDELREKLTTDGKFALALTMELIARSRVNARRMKSLALGSVYQRFREFVDQEAITTEGMSQLADGWSQQEIANRLGSSRDMVTKILRELGKGGYVRARRSQLTILKPLPKRW